MIKSKKREARVALFTSNLVKFDILMQLLPMKDIPMKKTLLITTVLAALTFTGCTDPMSSTTPRNVYQAPTEAKMAKFQPVMTQVALSTRSNPNYNKMAIRAEDKEWFKMLMYRYWDRQITRSQFISEGISRYPGHEYEFGFIANGFQQYS